MIGKQRRQSKRPLGEIRNSKSEIRNKSECQKKKTKRVAVSGFLLRISSLFRISSFGFRIFSRSLQLNRPVGVLQERLPGLVLVQAELLIEHRAALGLFRLADQAQVRLLGRAAALADVAGDAGADDVLPGALAALAPRRHVVQAQFRGREPLAAILALVVVAREDVAAVELHRLLRQLFVGEQTNDSWHLDFAVDGAHPVVVRLPEVARAVFAEVTPGR